MLASGVNVTASTAAPRKTRHPYWDALRGISIIAVIWIHARSGIEYLDGPNAGNFAYWLSSRQVLNFPVALFLFLAGYFVNPSRLRPAMPWLKDRSIKLIVPFLVWSLLYGLLEVVMGGEPSPASWLVKVITGATAAHLYFVLVLIQLTMLTPFLIRAVRISYGWLGFFVTPVFLVGLYGYVAVAGTLPAGYNYVFPAWFVFYYAGLWARHRAASVTKRAACASVAAALVLSLVESRVLLTIGFPAEFAASQLKATSVLYALAIASLALAFKPAGEGSSLRKLASLGASSYGVYYCHMLWILAFGYLTQRWAILADFPVLPVFQIIEVVAVLGLSLVTVWLGRLVLRRHAALVGF